LVAVAFVILALASSASATTLRVPSEYTTINAALDATSPNNLQFRERVDDIVRSQWLIVSDDF
jgi:hypothetical protein